MFVLYILENKSSRIYIGQTNDLDRRLIQHNDPLRKAWTSRWGPWKVVFTKDFGSRREAMAHEKYLKSLKDRDTVLKQIAGWRSSTSTGS